MSKNLLKGKTNFMVIYNSDTNTLYVPKDVTVKYVNGTQDIYNQAFLVGYKDGYDAGQEECQNNGKEGEE